MQAGIYQHYKGKKYLVIGTARHTETDEELVVYVTLYEHPGGGLPMQVRPRVMFNEFVKHNGEMVPRFMYLSAWLEPETRNQELPGTRN